jgi:Ala-tRNA(Pro) deacylase
MLFVSEPKTAMPIEYGNAIQEMTYNALQKLKISFLRVETDEVITMEDCAQINQKLNSRPLKTRYRHQEGELRIL